MNWSELYTQTLQLDCEGKRIVEVVGQGREECRGGRADWGAGREKAMGMHRQLCNSQ